MMKLVVRFLLSCFFLFLVGYAYTSTDRIGHFRKNTVLQSASSRDAAVQTGQHFLIPATPSKTRNVYVRLKATQEEDDDDDEWKNHSGACNRDIASFYTPAWGYLSHSRSRRLPFCEHLSYTSAAKFIIHCVFRI
jgi:hypothetical protein